MKYLLLSITIGLSSCLSTSQTNEALKKDPNDKRIFVHTERPYCGEFMSIFFENKNVDCEKTFEDFQALYSRCRDYTYESTSSFEHLNEQFEALSLNISSCFEQKNLLKKVDEVHHYMLGRPDFEYFLGTRANSFHSYLKAHMEAEEERRAGKYAKCLSPTSFQVEVESFLLSGQLDRLEPLVKKPFDTGLEDFHDTPFSEVKAKILEMTPDSTLTLLKKEGRCYWIEGWSDGKVYGICHQNIAINQTKEACYFWASFPRKE